MDGSGMGFQPGFGGLIGLLIYAAVIVVPFYQLWRRTGHNGWVALLMVIPLVNLVMLWALAFKSWPIERPQAGGGA